MEQTLKEEIPSLISVPNPIPRNNLFLKVSSKVYGVHDQ